RSRFVAESRIVALATLGNLSRTFAELRVNVRSHLLSVDDAERGAAGAAFGEEERGVTDLLQQYADGLVLGDQERRLFTDFQRLSAEWVTGAKQAMALMDAGQRRAAGRGL